MHLFWRPIYVYSYFLYSRLLSWRIRVLSSNQGCYQNQSLELTTMSPILTTYLICILTSMDTFRCTIEQWNCLVSISLIDFINIKSGRIRALPWYYLIMTYQSHNNKNDHLTRPWEGPGLNAWVFRYPTPRSYNKQQLLWKISSAHNQGLPLCWLTQETKFTYFQISTSKLSICITIHDETYSGLFVDKNRKTSLKFLVSYEIDTTKDSESK